MRFSAHPLLFILILFLPSLIHGCHRPDHSTSESSILPTPCEDPEADWSYLGESGPDHWAKLSSCFGLCDAGSAQSPIDLTDAVPTQQASLRFDYKPAPLRIHNNGHTIQVQHDHQSSLDFSEMKFTLRQFHFHAPSEHTIDGRHAPLEMHLVHTDVRGKPTVVGVMFEVGTENKTLAPIWEHFPPTPGENQEIPGVAIDTAGLLPAKTDASYRYDGSLTAPPCFEGVRWIVLQDPLTLSAEQLFAFTSIYDGNNRPLQDLADQNLTQSMAASP